MKELEDDGIYEEPKCDNCWKKGNYDLFMCPTKMKCIPRRDYAPKQPESDPWDNMHVEIQKNGYLKTVPNKPRENKSIQTIDDLLNEREEYVQGKTQVNESEIYNEGYIAGYNQAVKDKSKEFVEDLESIRMNFHITKVENKIRKWEDK